MSALSSTPTTPQPAARTPFGRGIAILALLLVAQIALAAFLLWPRASEATSGPLFATLDPADVAAVTLTWDDDVLRLQKQGDGWVLPERGGYPVNAINVTNLLTKVVQIDTSRLVADNATSHARLRVAEDDTIRRIEMTTADGESHSLLLGTSPNARATHVRALGSDHVYLTSALSTADVRMDAAAWIDTLYLEADPEGVRALTLENAQGSFALERDDAGAWTLDGLAEGESVNQENASLLTDRLAALTMLEPLGTEPRPEYGLDAPAAEVTVRLAPTATVTTAAGESAGESTDSVTLAIGTLITATNTYPVQAGSSEFIVAVSSATLDPFVNFGRADLVVTPVVTETAALTDTLPITDTTP